MNILELLEKTTSALYRKKSAQEYSGPCPFCQAGEDRFCIWPEEGRYWCRVCQAKGDAIQFLRDYMHMGYKEACAYLERGDCCDNNIHNNHNNHNNHINNTNHNNHRQTLSPPSSAWLAQAKPLLTHCQGQLWSDAGARALSWLRGRGLTDATIQAAGLGYNDHDHYVDRQAWGLPPEVGENGKPKGLWLPRGVVIPWLIGGELWGIRFRRPIKKNERLKYYWLPGGTSNTLYNSDAVTPGQPVALLESEIDVLTVQQSSYIAVATGGTSAGRLTKWAARLSTASTVLVAYDNDEGGNEASAYWIDVLSNARRWRPYWSDANDLHQAGVDIAKWVQAGINEHPTTAKPPQAVDVAPMSTTQPALPARFHELLCRPLLKGEADDLRLMAEHHDVKLEWERIDLNG